MTAPAPTSAALFANANQGVRLAASLGLTMPDRDRWEHAAACVAEARKITAEPEPVFPGLPDDPAKLRPAIVKAAQARAAHTTMLEMAAEAEDHAARTAWVLYRNAAPGFIDQLADRFAAAAAEFLEHRVAASDTINAGDSDEQVAAHVAMTRAAARLDELAGIRRQFADACGEFIHATQPWHVLAPARVEQSDAVQACRDLLWEMSRNSRDWAERSPVSRWTLFSHAGTISMAPLGQIPPRADTWARVEADAGGGAAMTPQGSEIARRERHARMQVAAAR